MKKCLVLILIFMLILPAQVLAATSAKEVDKLYFEDYSTRFKEIRAAQKSITPAECTDVASLTAQYKNLTTSYKNLKKSKASKLSIDQAKTSLDKTRKSLSNVKKECTRSKALVKKTSNELLAGLNKYKSEAVKVIRNYMDGKSKMTEAEFQKYSSNAVSYIHDRLTFILDQTKK